MLMQVNIYAVIYELQLKHGLRVDDYQRYHVYLSHRLATIRRQLHISGNPKSFSLKQIPSTFQTDARHALLWLFYAERAWVSGEDQQAWHQKPFMQIPPGGRKPKSGFRKRLNKAVKYAETLYQVSLKNGTECFQKESNAYLFDLKGRCASGHGHFAEAVTFFEKARNDLFHLLRDYDKDLKSCNNVRSSLLWRITALDERVRWALHAAGKNISQYNPSPIPFRNDALRTVCWFNISIPIQSISVAELLTQLPCEEERVTVCSRALQRHQQHSKPRSTNLVFPRDEENRILDQFNEWMSLLHEALDILQKDLGGSHENIGTDAHRHIRQLIHYCNYHMTWLSIQRTRFLVDINVQRYRTTLRLHSRENPLSDLLESISASPTKNSSKPPPSFRHFDTTPATLVRLYDAAMLVVRDLQLIPEVVEEDSLSCQGVELECYVGHLFYKAESYRIIKDIPMARTLYCEALKVLLAYLPSSMGFPFPNRDRLNTLHCDIVKILLALEASQKLTSLPHSLFLSDTSTNTTKITLCKRITNIQKLLERDVIAAPCKPVLMDIARTFLGNFSDNELFLKNSTAVPSVISEGKAQLFSIPISKSADAISTDSAKIPQKATTGWFSSLPWRKIKRSSTLLN